MDNNLTISLLNTLTKSELTALGKFLQSPFFTAKKFLYPLFSELRDIDSESSKNAEAVFARVFPTEAFGKGIKWNKALSDLNACILDFFAVRQVLEAPGLRTQAEISALYHRKNERLFQRKVGAALHDLPGSGIPEMTEDRQLRFWVLKQALSYPFADRMKSLENGLDEMEESLDLYYFISKLQLACNRASQAQFLRLHKGQAVFQQLLDQTEALDQLGKSALLTLYRALLYLLATPGAQFGPFFVLIQAQGSRLERVELESVVRFAFNYCIRRHREGEAAAFSWYRQLFVWADEQKVWTAEVSEELFLNTGVMFAKSRDAEGFNAFWEKCNAALPDDRRDDAASLLQAYHHFYQSNFEAAARALAPVEVRHPRYALLYHSLRVRNTYEQWALAAVGSDELKLSLDSFREFLKRKDMFAESLRLSYITLIWFVRKLAQNSQKQALTKEQLIIALKERQPALRDWVTAKVDGLPNWRSIINVSPPHTLPPPPP